MHRLIIMGVQTNMKILLDTANTAKIEQILPYFPIDGFTTNPSILAKESSDVKATLLRLKELSEGKRMIHAQVTAAHADDILAQAKQLKAFLGEQFYAKIPMTLQGLRAVPMCKAEGINVTVTAIFTPMQALMAGIAGADYVAPYVDRLDNITSDGVAVVGEIVRLFKSHNLPTHVLAASFKNVQQIYNVSATGAQAVTISCDLCLKTLFHPYTDKSLQDFEIDWQSKFGSSEITDLIK